MCFVFQFSPCLSSVKKVCYWFISLVKVSKDDRSDIESSSEEETDTSSRNKTRLSTEPSNGHVPTGAGTHEH